MERFALGRATRRIEDERLLTGRGRYTDDVAVPGQARAWVLRSPYAHAEITGLDATKARAMPGVLAVYTAADIEAAGLGRIPVAFRPNNAATGR